MPSWTFWAQIPIIIFGLWLFIVYTARSLPTLANKRIVFLIAHPDDEAMFFAPSLQWLTHPALNNRVLLLCLSTGDADGLGKVRQGELVQSAQQLGIRDAEHIAIVDDVEKFPDSQTQRWEAKDIANLLARSFAPDLSKQSASEAPTARIDVIVTFDRNGVSGHPNHISLYHGAMAFLALLMQRHPGWECPVTLYVLTSTNIVRKYSSIVDALVTLVTCVFRRKEKGETPTPLVMMNGPVGMRVAQRAMTTAHKSQMRWFRWGWIGISRYMVINDLVKVNVVGTGARPGSSLLKRFLGK